MLYLPKTVAHWNQEDFVATFTGEVLSLPRDALSLHKAMSRGNMVSDDDIDIMVIAYKHHGEHINLRAGVFFRSIIAGCSCADDPTPVDTIEEYAELEFSISLNDASASSRIVA